MRVVIGGGINIYVHIILVNFMKPETLWKMLFIGAPASVVVYVCTSSAYKRDFGYLGVKKNNELSAKPNM